ncbi:MAG: sigma-54 dependent transcriptional regulator [Planctomycetota bacterium]|mgnify:CR=1 FL=1
MNGKILVIDDEELIRILLDKTFQSWNLKVTLCSSGNQALESFQAGEFDLAIVDLRMPGLNGVDVLKSLKQADPEIDVIMMTAYGSVESAVEALKSGAVDYIGKPINLEHLKLIIERCLRERQQRQLIENLQSQVSQIQNYGKLVGISSVMQKIYQMIEKVAGLDSAVLIEGETGTGKEVVAREIHLRSQRKTNKFVALSCAALPETLLESELFGYEAGAFTGAAKRKPGLIEVAHNGTLFLDEITEIPMSFQIKLLRVLETREFMRLGSTDVQKSNFRLITAANKDVKEQVEKNIFREDLFYRINVIDIEIPPLRKRLEDIPLLANYFFNQLNETRERKIQEINIEAMLLLTKYSWPGNVRELAHVIERACSLDSDGLITLEDLPEVVRFCSSQAPIQLGQARKEFPKQEITDTINQRFGPETLKSTREQAEKEYIEKILEETGGNVSAASRRAGLTRAKFHLKIRKYRIEPDKYRKHESPK